MSNANPAPGGRTGVSRRTALKFGVLGIIGVAAGAGSTAVITRLIRSVPSRYRFFTDAEASLLTGICDQIIPRDDVPGAAEAGAVNYIDRQLGGVFARHRQTYRRGLDSFRRSSRSRSITDRPMAPTPA